MSRSIIIYFKSYCPDTDRQTRNVHRTDCSTRTTDNHKEPAEQLAFLLQTWTLTYDDDFHTWSRQKEEPTCHITGFTVLISSKLIARIYTHETDCCTWTTKVVSKTDKHGTPIIIQARHCNRNWKQQSGAGLAPAPWRGHWPVGSSGHRKNCYRSC